jgi:AAA+ ATPase superfamily predicted ATPase
MNRGNLLKQLGISVEINLGPFSVEVKKGSRSSVKRGLIELLLSINRDVVIGLDEVQELLSVTGQLLEVLGNVFASNPKVRFMFSGSYVGLVKALLNPREGSPLVARPPVEVKLRPFDRKDAVEFLKKGMEELKAEFDDSRAGSEQVGRRSLLADLFRQLLRGEESLRVAVEEGKKVMLEELNHFLEGRDRKLYLATLSSIKVDRRWKDGKFALEVKEEGGRQGVQLST